MWFGKRAESKTFLALDVGTEVVKALVSTMDETRIVQQVRQMRSLVGLHLLQKVSW